MRMALSLLLLAGLCSVGRLAPAQELEATTEFGVTVTTDQVSTAIGETQDFWGPVKKHLASPHCDYADAKTRQAAVAFLKKVHDSLHAQLFDKDEAAAEDLLDYLSSRLRRFALLRQLRTELADDAALANILEQVNRAQREANLLTGKEQADRLAQLRADLPRAMAEAKVNAAKIPAAMKTWELVLACSARMNSSDAGKLMLGFERDARKLPAATSDLLRRVSDAADWALIVRADGAEYGRDSFLRAWSDLAVLHQARTAAKPAAASK